jgi:farnesyl-diphosphate farnesyltransferase
LGKQKPREKREKVIGGVHSGDSYLLKELLRDVSRSFYLTLRILPRPIRNQIGLAYLLARATDTIADTGAVSVIERLSALRILRQRILAPKPEPFSIPELQASQGSSAERVLLERINDIIELLFGFLPDDRALIQNVIEVITEGQELDLLRFGSASPTEIKALDSDAELDDYTYRVAGCVGEFWTRMCVARLKPKPRIELADLIPQGIRFGKGLQLVNILRDLPSDLRQGRCYLPWPALQLIGLRPADLLDPVNESKLRPVYNQWLATAEEHLKIGWSYVLNLPWRWIRVRLACAWPILIGLKTIDKLKVENVLNPDTRIRVSRPEIKSIIRASVLLYAVPSAWARLPERVRVPKQPASKKSNILARG